jgi:apolipoprotein D and lipocalin family protein
MKIISLLIAAVLGAGLLLLVNRASADAKRVQPTAQQSVDIPRFMGRWWVIANIPYFAERNKVATADEYELLKDGRIKNVYVYREAFGKPEKRMNGKAKVSDGSNGTKWKVKFFGGLVNADFEILEVSEDYSWALIGHPKREMGWVFSRNQAMDDATYQQLLERMKTHGYDTSKFMRVPQFAEQKGKPGFQ